MKTRLALLIALVTIGSSALAVSPWPAEGHTDAVPLTPIDAGLNTANWSGAFWNPDTRTLWLACNSGYFWALVENGSGSFIVATNSSGTAAKWTPGGDLEGICQASPAPNRAYLMDENGYIREYDVSQYGVVHQTLSWNITNQCPEVGASSGGEGIAFVPDDWLRRQAFCDSNGVPCVSSNGMGGLMLVGYQADGFVYAFDLAPVSNSFTFVGRYQTGRSETADLHFDTATGQLYVWHNTGSNYLEVVELHSDVNGSNRRLRPLAEYVGPRTGNLEGFTLLPSSPTNHTGGCLLTDDDNLNGEAIMWYQHFQPDPDTDADGMTDGFELWHFGSTTQTVGTADDDSDGLSNADEEVAGTQPTNESSALIQYAPTADTEALVLSWQSASGRTYAIHSTALLTNGFTNIVFSHIPADVPLNIATVNVSDLLGLSFYRVALESP